MNGFVLASGDLLTVTSYKPKERKLAQGSNGIPSLSPLPINNLYVKNFPSPHFDEFEL
jgi:hypothetical protein